MNWWANMPWKQRARRRAMEDGWFIAGFTPDDVERLAAYNSECARGIVHTVKYDGEMYRLQGRYNRWLRASDGTL